MNKRHRELILPKSYWLNAMANIKRFKKKIDFKIILMILHMFWLFQVLKLLSGIRRFYEFIFLYIIYQIILGYFPWNLEHLQILLSLQIIGLGLEINMKDGLPSDIYKDWLWQDKNGEIRKPWNREIKFDLNRVTLI